MIVFNNINLILEKSGKCYDSGLANKNVKIIKDENLYNDLITQDIIEI